MSKSEGKQIAIRFNSPIADNFNQLNNSSAFNITGQEYNMVPGGFPVAKTYSVASVRLYTELNTNTILLTLNPTTRFNNIVGNLTITYDKTKGNLKSGYRVLNSFTLICTPTELIPVNNPNDPEHLDSQVAFNVAVLEVTYIDAKLPDESLTSTTDFDVTVMEVFYTYIKSADENLTASTGFSVSVTEV